jgi:branched-chain amino acid transport system substrate-binding protein
VLGTAGAQFLDQVAKAANQPVKTVAVLHEQGPFGSAVRDAFKAEAEKAGIKVGPALAYDAANVSDLTTQVTQVKASGADVLMVAGYYRDGVLAAKAVATVKPPALKAVYGVANGAFDLPQFPKEAGAAAEGFFDANYHADMTNADTQALAKLYQERYNDQIRTGAVLAHDSVKVIADALERAGSAEPAKVRDAIASGSVPTLIAGNGPIKFGPTGENENATPILMQVQGGVVKQVFPADKAEEKPLYPAFKSQ